MHYAVRFIHTAPLLVGFIFPTLQMKKLRDRTKSLVESDSPLPLDLEPQGHSWEKGCSYYLPCPLPSTSLLFD